MTKHLTDIPNYIQQTSPIINLPISPECMPGVVDNLTKIAEISTLITEFELPETIEIAPVFQP